MYCALYEKTSIPARAGTENPQKTKDFQLSLLDSGIKKLSCLRQQAGPLVHFPPFCYNNGLKGTFAQYRLAFPFTIPFGQGRVSRAPAV
jgi:hypothetical protein